MNPKFTAFATRAGIHFMTTDNPQFQLTEVERGGLLAQDAQPLLVTQSNAGIPAYLTTFVDTKLIQTLVAPMKAAQILGEGSEIKKGDWTSTTAMFMTGESVGEVSTYGDFNNNGHADTNINFPQRQAYHYQTITEWGEKEMAIMGLAKVDLSNQKNIASVLVLNKYQNQTYFFGVAGLQNYGLLNDPSLPAPITPTVKTGGGTTWAVATGLEVLADIAKLYAQLVTQSNSLVDLETPMVLVMSAALQVSLTKTTEFNVNVMDLLRKNFPNLRIETAPEYTTPAGNFIQLIVPMLDGQKTAEVGFTEKLRAHPIKVDLSSFAQKKSQGTWGAIIYRPYLIASMIGA